MATETTQVIPGFFENGLGLAISIMSLVVIGFLAVIGFFTKRRNEIQDKTAEADNRLIGLLQGTVAELEKKLTNQTKDLSDALKRLTAVETENSMFKEIFQGRDVKMQEFVAQGFVVMAQVPDMIKVIQATNKNVEKLYGVIEQHLLKIEEKVTPNA